MGTTLFDEPQVYNSRHGNFLVLKAVGATALFLATCYGGNEYLKNLSNQKLPEEIRQ